VLRNLSSQALRTMSLLVALAACEVGEVPVGGTAPDAGGGGGGADGGGGGGGGGAGSLQVTFTTGPTAGGGGQYSPNNIVAVWIEGPGGTFVKTVGRWAGVRKQHLVAWTTAAGAADADAVSGATRTSYTPPLTVTWNLLNRQNTVIPDGTYTVRMELTDLNATTAAQNNQGTFTFVKGPAPQSQTALSNGGFTNVSIQFTP